MKKADIRIAWPSRRGGIAVSTDIGYRVGQEGVWVLTADKKLPVYWATYPTDHQPLAKLAEFKKKLANVRNIKWGEKKGGLQVGMIVEQRDLRNSKVQVNGRPVKAIGQLTVYPLLKNATDKPMHVVNNFHDQPFSLAFTDGDGSPIDVKLYGNQPAKSVPLRQHNFINVPPGGVSPISYGFGLPTLTEAGVYSIELAYRNKRGGEALKIEAVWKGSATSPTVKIDVPAKNK
ncbi:MAG: hypothetical protein IH991_03545 [Planctomycetes bacterium]|nr:hypothetical protein [Planctomycetota bacterium]